jgi:hypothetical protein
MLGLKLAGFRQGGWADVIELGQRWVRIYAHDRSILTVISEISTQ